MLLISEEEVRRHLPMQDAIRAVREAFAGLAEGTSQNQARRRLILPTKAVLHSMAGSHGGWFGTKIYSTHPEHGAHFLVALYEAETAGPVALFEADALGQIRTGAATGVAADLLAEPEASVLGIIGSGYQARTQVEAALAVRPIRHVRVWSRSVERREKFAAWCRERLEVEASAAASAREAVEGASIVVTATTAREPVLEAGWVKENAFVAAIGSNQAKRRELPAELVKRAAVIAVDSLEQARIESGDLLLALPEERWKELPLIELGEIVRCEEFCPPPGIRIFESHGLGVQDVAVAALVYERVKQTGGGMRVGWFQSMAGI